MRILSLAASILTLHMRLPLFALLSLLFFSPVLASPPLSGKPTPDIANSLNKLHRGVALPKWIQPLADVPATQRSDAVVVRLFETQAWVSAQSAILVNKAIQVNEQNSLGAIGQFGINFYPTYQKLFLHRVAILRGNQRIDHTATVSVRQLQRETNMESGMYGGATTVQLLLDDVRVGDTLLITYTVEGENPVFGKRWANDFSWDSGAPIELRRLTILHPRNRTLYWRQLGDFRTEKITPAIDESGDIRRIRFEGRDMAAIEYEPSIPADYLPGRMLQLSEYQDWRGVANWADGLFPKTTASPALKLLARQFDKESDPASKVSAALRWVQNEVRYFSVSIGENSHRPQAPETVINHRYGDCKDKSYLLVSLLAQLGIEAHPVLLSADAPKFPAKVAASPNWFNHVIVQVNLDGRQYYVDPTRTGQPEPLAKLPTAFPGAAALVVATDTHELTTLPERTDTEPYYEHVENIAIPSFDGDATLEMRDIYRGPYADAVRVRFPSMPEVELKKEVLASYEKQYPGITLAEAPVYRDDSAANSFEVRARFTLSKPLSHKDQKYGIDYDSQIIAGTLGIPNKIVRNYPFALPNGKYRGRYRLNITWPATVRANETPEVKMLDNRFFNMREEFIHRGNYLSYLMDYRVKENVVNAADLPELQKQAKQLNDFISGKFYVFESGIVSSESLGFSYRDVDSARKANQLLSKANSFKGRKESEIAADDVCDMLIGALEIIDLTGQNIRQAAAELEPMLVSESKQPGVKLCLARVLFGKGEFAKSIALYQAESPLKDDSPFTRDLAWARFYAGDVDGALADIARYRAAREKQDSGAAKGFDVASEIALYQRSGRPVPAELVRFAGEIPDGPWPRPLLAMQAGVIGQDVLIKSAEALPADTRELALSDAWYYIGQARLAAHDTAGATAAFRWVNTAGIRSSGLHLQAKAELQRLQPTDANYESGLRAFDKKDYVTAVAKWRESAALGLASAQYQLGLAYYRGNGVKQDYMQAMRWFEMAAAQKLPEAMNMVGVMHENGAGVPTDDMKAVVWFKKAAELGDSDAQYSLGFRYRNGRSVGQDYVQAVHYYRLSAEQGDASAQAALAVLYRDGLGVAQDYAQAKVWSTRSAFQSNSEGQVQLGYLYDLGYGVPKDYANSLKFYRLAAAQGNAMAQNNIGIQYEAGHGVTQDYKEAAKWYRLAAEQGNSKAQDNLGDLYRYGRGVPKDYKEALIWYRKGAELGYAVAQFDLGLMYHNGWGVQRDYAEAFTWYSKSAEQGFSSAINNLGQLYENGQGVAKDDQKALKLYRQAAAQGYAYAQDKLGQLLEQGLVVPQDYKEALIWYRKAAEQGRADAQHHIGLMYAEGLGMQQDDKEAVMWFAKAAEQRYANAQFRLGTMYEAGTGIQQNYQEALKWYRKAAVQEFAPAQYNLGLMYADGQGTTRDPAEAMKWFRLATEQDVPEIQARVAFILRNGRGVAKNSLEAAKLLLRAAERGSDRAQNELGDMYENGDGLPQDYAQAIKLYRQSANAGYGLAFFSLGSLYESGKGLPHSALLAYTYYKIAARDIEKRAGPRRDAIAKLLSASELKAADELVANWKPGMPLPGESGGPSAGPAVATQ